MPTTTTGNPTDFQVYQDEYYSGLTESIDQNVRVLNEGAGGAIRVLTSNTRGQFENRSHFNLIDDLIFDRDPESNADLPVRKITQGEVKDILLNYGIGPVRGTLDSFRKLSQDPSLASFILGQQMGERVTQMLLNTGLGGLVAALSTESDVVYDNTVQANAERNGGSTINHKAMIRAKYLMGDRTEALRAIVANSAVAAELDVSQLSEKLGEVSGAMVYGASSGTLNLAAYITDSPALTFVDDGVTKHYVLMLTEGALTIEQQDYMDMLSDREGGKMNLSYFYQAESAYLARIKGFTWTGANAPTRGQFADSANWEYAYASLKDGPGVLLIVSDEEIEFPTTP